MKVLLGFYRIVLLRAQESIGIVRKQKCLSKEELLIKLRLIYLHRVISLLFLKIYFSVFLFLMFLKRFYLFIFRERGRERKKGRETSMCGCLSCTPK